MCFLFFFSYRNVTSSGNIYFSSLFKCTFKIFHTHSIRSSVSNIIYFFLQFSFGVIPLWISLVFVFTVFILYVNGIFFNIVVQCLIYIVLLMYNLFLSSVFIWFGGWGGGVQISQGWYWTFLDSFLSAAGDSLCFLVIAVTQHTLNLQKVVCTVDPGTWNCFEMAPFDFPDLLKSKTCFFRSILSSLDFPIVAESNGCIKQVLLTWTQKSHQLWSIRITQKLRGCATKNI